MSQIVRPPASGEKGFYRWLHNQMMAAFADGSFLRFNGYTVPGGQSFQYRTPKEFLEIAEKIEAKADIEDGVRPFHRRTYARQGGRG